MGRCASTQPQSASGIPGSSTSTSAYTPAGKGGFRGVHCSGMQRECGGLTSRMIPPRSLQT
eukprot:3685650-Alexandrium_andersonii.AAC.1